MHSFWRKTCENIEKKLDNINNFLEWPEITSTMNALSPEHLHDKLIQLQNSKEWPQWENAIKFDPWGGQKPSQIFKDAAANEIQLAFHLKIFLDNSSLKLDKISSIVEWGAGYGALGKIIYKMGYTGLYVMYDLPELSFLQRKYIDYHVPNGKVNTRSFWFDIEPDLFISTFGIAECPVEDRAYYLNCNPRYYLLAYGDSFENEINNQEYFNKFQSERSNYMWKDVKYGPITYLIGERIDSKSNSNRPDSA